MKKFFILAIAALLIASPAMAQMIPVINPGFEIDAVSDGSWIYSASGWTIFGGSAGTWDPTGTGTTWFTTPLSLTEQLAFSNGGTFSQVLGTNLVAGLPYILSVDIGSRLDVPTPGYQVQLLAGGVVLAMESSLIIPAGSFMTSTINYTAVLGDPIGQPLEIRLLSSGVQTDFDNVHLSIVPEPGTLLLLGTGLLGVGIAARIRRKRS